MSWSPTPTSPSKLTDTDLAKAASAAAQKLTPKVVMEIMSRFNGAKSVNALKDGSRQKFVDVLNKRMEEGK